MSEKNEQTADLDNSELKLPIKTCGVVMPISEMDGYSESHWRHVFSLIKEVTDSEGFETRIVSESPEVGVIQKRIVQNLYNDDIVIVDVSGKNPNVMFELGLRLAFDKPTIIIQDDFTKAPFDTSIIEYLEYPKSLHYYDVLVFKHKLKSKISATVKKFNEDETYSTFLKHFGEFRVAEISTKEVSGYEFLIKELREIRDEIASDRIHRQRAVVRRDSKSKILVDVYFLEESERSNFFENFDEVMPEGSVRLDLPHFKYEYTMPVPLGVAENMVRGAAKKAGLEQKLSMKNGEFEFLPF